MRLRDIFEFSSPEKQEELERLYGRTVISWNDVKSWDDVVIKEKKALVSELEEENRGKERCPFLKKLDNYFYFCESKAKKLEGMGWKFTDKPEISSCQYNSQTDHFSMQLWCMQSEERYKKCIYFGDLAHEIRRKIQERATFRDEHGIERTVEGSDL